MQPDDHKCWPPFPILCGNDRQYSVDQIYHYHTLYTGRSLMVFDHFAAIFPPFPGISQFAVKAS